MPTEMAIEGIEPICWEKLPVISAKKNGFPYLPKVTDVFKKVRSRPVLRPYIKVNFFLNFFIDLSDDVFLALFWKQPSIF